jgi:hypothetical protein
MPGARLERSGGVRHCQGRALSDWAVDGRIASVTGFWSLER